MGLARVVLDGEVQCINTNAELSGPCNWTWQEWKAEDKKLPDGRQVVTRSQLRGLVNGSGRIVLPIIYQQIRMIESGIKQFDYLEGYYLVKRFNLYGVIKRNGDEVLPIVYDHIRNFHHSTGVAIVERNGKQGLIERSFKLVIPCEYEALSSPQIPGFVAFRQNGLWGWMDYTGKVAVVPQFDQIGWMYDGRMRVEKGKKFGIVDINGREVIPIKYEGIEDRFYNGYIRAILNKKYGYLDSTGAVVIPFEYEEVRNFEKPIAGAQKGKFYGFIDRNGKEVVPYIYDFVDHSWYSDGLVKVVRKGKIGYVDATGKEVIPCIYDEERGFNPSKGRYVLLKHEWKYVKAEAN
ncbi:MAG: WG repeat-containing protein, partial [Chitinophagaceae bacterium]|nr:WG repeat-containing protein [Chitinophagaceae bacterium]